MSDSPARREIVTFASPTLGREWTFSVILPAGYGVDEATHYPLVILLHGYGASEALQDMSPDQMVEWADRELIGPAILVGPAGYNGWFLNSYEAMHDAVTTDLLDEVRRRYRVRPGPEHTSLLGFSMGGYASLRFLLSRPDLFGAAALVSPAVYDPQPPATSGARSSSVFGNPFSEEKWTEQNYPSLLPLYLRGAQRRPVWIAAGLQDVNVLRASRRLFRRLVAARQPVSLTIYPEGHVPPPWIIFSALQFLRSDQCRLKDP